jgi:hypothetical protein
MGSFVLLSIRSENTCTTSEHKAFVSRKKRKKSLVERERETVTCGSISGGVVLCSSFRGRGLCSQRFRPWMRIYPFKEVQTGKMSYWYCQGRSQPNVCAHSRILLKKTTAGGKHSHESEIPMSCEHNDWRCSQILFMTPHSIDRMCWKRRCCWESLSSVTTLVEGERTLAPWYVGFLDAWLC